MRTASALTRNCGLVTKLSKARPRSAAVQATMAEGTRFGRLVQDWIEGRDPQPPEVLDEPWCWFEFMRAAWRPPYATRCEVPFGLSPAGDYVEVTEPSPHVYIPAGVDPMQQKLATAGRADLVWMEWSIDVGTNRMDEDVAVVADLKRSTWRYGAPAQVPQLMALGCAAARRARVPFMKLGLYDARDGVWEWSDVLNVNDVLPEVLEICALPEDEARPGEWCSSCWERKACPTQERRP